MVMHRLVAPEQAAVVRLKIAECLAGLTFTSGVPQVANEAALDPRVNRTSARSLGVRTGMRAAPSPRPRDRSPLRR